MVTGIRRRWPNYLGWDNRWHHCGGPTPLWGSHSCSWWCQAALQDVLCRCCHGLCAQQRTITFSNATARSLASLGVEGGPLMDWPACSPDRKLLVNPETGRVRRWTSICVKGRVVEGPQDAGASVQRQSCGRPSGCRGFCTHKKTDSTDNDEVFKVIRLMIDAFCASPVRSLH